MYRFKEAREACGMQQKGVALALGVTVQTVSFWENSKRKPGYENITKLAKLYGVSVDYLLGNDKPEGEPEGEPAEDRAERQPYLSKLSKRSANHLKILSDLADRMWPEEQEE